MSTNTTSTKKTKPETLLSNESVKYPETIVKRNGQTVRFDVSKIEKAIKKCFKELEDKPKADPAKLAKQVANIVAAHLETPTVESVQDSVEMVLQAAGEYKAAKNYILYRAEHAKLRENRPVPPEVQEAFAASDKYFPSQLQKFQFYDKYARFSYESGRRETWIETVTRAVDFLKELSDNKLPASDYERLRKGILEMKVMPSMRLLAMAGPAARRNNIAIYNCSYLPVDSIDSFVEALLISMSGCGVGYSVERDYVENFPRIKRQTGEAPKKHVVEDTTEGWCDALRTGLKSWFEGEDVEFDYSLVRQAGAVLQIKGGRASGPEPLRQLLDYAKNKILARQGSFLRTLDAHDIMCTVGTAAVSGGVRRTAMISLFDFDDYEMRHCKDGDFWRHDSQRWNANNSAVWPSRELSQAEISRYLLDMVESERGEPGIFNRRSALKTAPERRKEARFGTNPCGEIILRPFQFCNLSVAVARPEDSLETLKEKVELATIIGTLQSMATHFPGLRKQWAENCQEERLLGVDINGQLDCPLIQKPEVMDELREHAVAVNEKYASTLGINQSVSVTCVKPSGNSSQLLNCSPGIHSRWSDYYIRNVRVNTNTPIFKVLKNSGVPMDPENGQTVENATTWVVHFPVKSPDGAITRNMRSALEQCEYWLTNKVHWTEHNPSVTITYKPDEVLDIIRWTWENQERIGGMTFLPAFDAQFDQMPYMEISKEQYEKSIAEFPEIDFAKIYRYEEEDYTTAAQELACMAGQCDI
ncbi:adenosylcobalamin-dependent ribonucleoside-triphosphate reductase [Fulvitalea axinellae]|uniref:Adenosylcobalamin-dependent ribonucleoside-triphosphate reductase n=1 Tax=Fulvitalea axinellae TaxID=1182444 RepID=A0AAU9CPN6_9BACT|nr:adenosylcobalamin-dependent ribonucleoside-triphosphate reductase [Fulvitalea axinellae]